MRSVEEGVCQAVERGRHMNEKGVTNRMFLPLAVAVILVALITPAIGAEHPVEPFQKAKAMALKEGKVTESEEYGKGYILAIEGWGTIIYISRDETIMLTKGTPDDYAVVEYYGKTGKYHVSRRIKGGKPEITDVDRSVATDTANKYLREIGTARRKGK